MSRRLTENKAGRLERSCGRLSGDWIRFAPPQAGFERMEAFFTGHAFDPHRHDTYAIGYTLGGVQSFDYRGARADSTAGHAIVLHPDERHDGRAGAENGFLYRMLYIEPRLIRDALGPGARSLPFAPAAVSSDSRLIAALRYALADLDHALEPLALDQAVLGLAEALLALDPSAQINVASAKLSATSVERARAFLDANLTRTVGSDELEAASGLDRFTLARQFRAQLGTSPYRYLTMRRLDQAKAAMRAGASLADAAFASGFADQSHMTRQFKQTFGLSPGKWRAIQDLNAAS